MSGSDRERGRAVSVTRLPLRDAPYSHYAPKACHRPVMCRSSSMTVLLEEGWPQPSPTNTSSLSPSPCTPSPNLDVGPELRVVADSIGDDHIPVMAGLREMRHLGKSMDKVSLRPCICYLYTVCVCVCVCECV